MRVLFLATSIFVFNFASDTFTSTFQLRYKGTRVEVGVEVVQKELYKLITFCESLTVTLELGLGSDMRVLLMPLYSRSVLRAQIKQCLARRQNFQDIKNTLFPFCLHVIHWILIEQFRNTVCLRADEEKTYTVKLLWQGLCLFDLDPKS